MAIDYGILANSGTARSVAIQRVRTGLDRQSGARNV
jgi:hypothetical protein